MVLLQALAMGLMACSLYLDVTSQTAVLLAGAAVLLVMAARDRDSAPGPRWFAILLLLDAGSLAVSTAFSSNRALSLFGGAWRSYGAVTQCAAMLFAWLVARQSSGRPDRARVILRGVAIAAIACAAYGMAHARGTLRNAGGIAAWLAMSVFLDLALAKMETERAWRVVAQSAAAVSLAAILFTGSRAALLGVAAGMAVWLCWGGIRQLRRGVAAAALVVAMVCGARLLPWGGTRPLLWRDSLSMAARRPVAGYGPEVFPAEFPQFESRALAEADPDGAHESPRNILLDAMVAQGIPGLLLLGGLCAVGFAAAWRLKAGWLAAALAAGIVSQQFTAFAAPTAVLFLSTIALAAGMAAARGAPGRSAILAGVAPVPALALLYLALRLVMAGHALAVTQRLLEAHDARATTAEYENYRYWRLPGANADLWYSRRWMEVARNAHEIDVMEQAMDISEQAAVRATESPEEPSAVWHNLAQMAALHDDSEGTENCLRRAIAGRPAWFKPHWMLAQQLRREWRWEDAGKEAALAAELDAGHHPEVARTLAEIRARQTDGQAW